MPRSKKYKPCKPEHIGRYVRFVGRVWLVKLLLALSTLWALGNVGVILGVEARQAYLEGWLFSGDALVLLGFKLLGILSCYTVALILIYWLAPTYLRDKLRSL